VEQKSGGRHGQKRISTSRASRTLKTAGISARLATDVIWNRVAGAIERRLGGATEVTSVRGAASLLESIGALKGLVMKAGQVLSYVDLNLAPELKQTLAALQDSALPMAPEVSEQVIAEDLGTPPSEFFARWDRQPFASASIGQVHRARMRDGTEVAVKVQYPQIVEALESDLRNISVIQLLGWLFNRVQDRGALIAEIRERFLEECDYLTEAANQRDFHALYRGHPYIVVPEVISEYCTRRVLISRFVAGTRFGKFASGPSQAERNHAGEVIYEFVFRSIFRHGIFNCDPHPGNYLFLPRGRVAFLDFGCVKRFSPELLEDWRALVRAALERDRAHFDELIVKMGYVGDRARFDFDYNWRMFMYFYRPLVHDRPFRYTHEYVAESFAHLIADNKNRASFNLPKDTIFLNRLNWGLLSVLAELAAEANCRRLILPLLYGEGAPLPPPYPDGVFE
jgi:predicted unusual protein kinase regulating ubiquinone biosynthesis (AarF/ABC1/UbiB family)